jgi:serine/threonine-protein kinase
MGIVYKAVDTALDEKVALKILSPEIADSPRSLERFRREIKSARLVTHANVVRVHDVGESDGVAYLTMEFAPGQTLKAILGMAGRLEPRTAVDYARQACAGLAEAHRAGIIHRDLKPQNLMIDEHHRLRILDFGIARPLEGGGPTREGALIGTPAYMSPEQLAGGNADVRTDIYALGIILYEMTTGRPPFAPGANRGDPPPAPSSLNPTVPRSLDALILRCLAAEPAQRPASTEALEEDLAAVAGEIEPQGMRCGRSRSGRRVRLVPIIGLAAGAVVVAVLTWYFILRAAPDPTAQPGWESRLAVLPPLDASPGRDQALLCEGLAHDLRDKLAAAGGLKIISEYSSNRFRDTKADAAEVGRALGARHILTARLDLHDGTLSIDVRLDDAARAGADWRFPYSGPAADYFDIQAQIAADVMERLAGFRAASVAPTPLAADPASLEAYTEYLIGRRFEARYRERDAPEDFAEAARLYRGALARDPRYTLALRGLGDLHEARFVKTGDPTDLALMLENYRNAFQNNPALPDSMIAMGWSYFYQQNLAEAAGYFRKAREAGPSQPAVLLGLGAFLRSIGLYERAAAYFERAIEVGRETDPLSVSPAVQLASCRGFLGQADEAEKILARARIVDPDNARVRLLLVRQLLAQNRREEAGVELTGIGSPARLSPTLRRSYELNRIWLEAAAGRAGEAIRLIQASDRPFGYEVVNAYCLLGRKDEALAAIRDGIDRGFLVVKDYLYRRAYLLGNPLFEGLQGDPRFQRILAEQTAVEEELKTICAGL